jgi:hypothetical protein
MNEAYNSTVHLTFTCLTSTQKKYDVQSINQKKYVGYLKDLQPQVLTTKVVLFIQNMHRGKHTYGKSR